MIQLHQFNLEESLQLLRMDTEQLALLKEVRLVIERDSEEIVRNFYAHVTTLPRLKAIIDRFSTVETLKITMKKYLFTFFPEKIDEEFMQWRVTIGEVHSRSKLPPFYYLSANQFLCDEIIPRIFKHYRKKTDQAIRASLAFQRLLNFDQQVVMASYIQSYMTEIDKKAELEKALVEIDNLQRSVNDASQVLAATSEETACAPSVCLSIPSLASFQAQRVRDHTLRRLCDRHSQTRL